MAAAASQCEISRSGASADRISNVTLKLGGKTIVENISLDVKPGEFLCIIGASGCGKTTALRLAAGLYQPTSGSVTFDGKPMLAPRRDIAIVFQDYGKALLPWRTAAGNVSLALEASGVASSRAGGAHRRFAEEGRAAQPWRKISGGDVGRNAAAPADCALPRAGAQGAVDG